MCLNEELLSQCEEFFDLIANENEDELLANSIESLRTLLEGDVDGWTSLSEEDLRFSVESHLEEIWSLITDEEKKDNYMLEDFYEEIMSELKPKEKVREHTDEDLDLDWEEFERGEDEEEECENE